MTPDVGEQVLRMTRGQRYPGTLSRSEIGGGMGDDKVVLVYETASCIGPHASGIERTLFMDSFYGPVSGGNPTRAAFE